MKLQYTISSFLFAGLLTVSGQSFAADSAVTDDSESTPREWTGDIYRIPAEELDSSLSLLEQIEGRVLFSRDDLYLIIYPADATLPEPVASSRRLRPANGKKHTLPPLRLPRQKRVATMENARFFYDANLIHSGEGLPCAFDGFGVVTGMSDVGFDANHSAFLNADGSQSRVRKFVHYEVTEGRVDVLSTPEEIAAYSTDFQSQTHGTHVAGIMAGRGGGGKYIGMAPGADIVATTSDLYDVGILAGIEEIIAYAKSVDKPAVINISIGSYGGPHDGSSLFAQYLDKCADDAIICISTGNEGEHKNHIGHTFKSDTDQITFRMDDKAWTFFNPRGTSEIWSDDETPVKVGIYIRDTANSGNLYSGPLVDLSEEPEWILTSDPQLADSDPRYHYDEEYAKHFDGEIIITGGIDPENGRFCSTIYYLTDTETMLSASKPWARYQIGGYVTGTAGQRVNLYADGVQSSFIGNQGTPRPDSDMSISDLATGKKVITVGAYWSSEGETLNNGYLWAGGTPLTVCAFTSYGTLIDGRVTPMTVAPGGPIISAYSGPYVDLYGDGFCAYEHDGNYWGVDSGTSMSTPYVAGAIATWLQANPAMTWKDAQDLILESNDAENYPLETNPRHGLGFFNPYKGLKTLADRGYTDVETILSRSLFANYGNGVLTISNPDMREVKVELYLADGRKLTEISAGSNPDIRLSADLLNIPRQSGVVVCRITAPGATPEILKILR
ncbi:MAG: S8 family serine peptidase [Muribaculaceae bacterium]|nr:S8 family serine peptidase [Muribaculaceae bacterium]